MARLTLGFGLALIVLAFGFYGGTGWTHKTALIPAFPGLVLAICGGLTLAKPNARKHAMHVAVAIAALGFLAVLRAVPAFFTLLTGGSVDRPAAVIEQVLMGVICLVYVLFGVKSFIDARRARQAGESGEASAPQ